MGGMESLLSISIEEKEKENCAWMWREQTHGFRGIDQSWKYEWDFTWVTGIDTDRIKGGVKFSLRFIS